MLAATDVPDIDLTEEHRAVACAPSSTTRKRRIRTAKDAREAWVAEVPDPRVAALLRSEWRPRTARRVQALRLLAERVATMPVLIWGAGVGTWTYPFEEFDCQLTLVESLGAVSDVLRTRLDRARVEYDYARPRHGAPGEGYAAVVLTSLLAEPAPFELLGELLPRLAPSGLLVTSLEGGKPSERLRCQRRLHRLSCERVGTLTVYARGGCD